MEYRNVLLAVSWIGILLCIPGVQGECEKLDCLSYEFECDDGECISRDDICDLYDDCEDGSDENNCSNHTCDTDYFRCKNGQCVPSITRCDGQDECADKSDEENCFECSEFDWGGSSKPFKCVSHQLCIDPGRLCNSVNDCPDGSDEDPVTCQNIRCTEWEFQCGTGNCISSHERCNGRLDCHDNSDELNCSLCEPLKGHEAFKCQGEERCILGTKVCDMEPDCVDGSDESEMTCRNFTCGYGEFQCKSGQCLSSPRCNGHNDCNDENDKSDEANCTHCSPKAFKCGSGECVHKYNLCNSIRECSDGSDEDEISCPEGSTPPIWTTFWRFGSISLNQNVTLKYLTEDLAVYFESSVSPSVTWPFATLSQAWKYAKEAYGPNITFSDPGSQFLYVVLGKRKKDDEMGHTIPSKFWASGNRNLMDVGLRERNGWATQNSANLEKLISGLGFIVRIEEEGTFNLASIRACGHDIDNIVLYDIYVHLKGRRSPQVMRWRDTQCLSRTHELAKANCFRDLFLPIYESHGGTAVLKNYFQIFRANWPKKKGVYSETDQYQFKQLNVGEVVHFWSGAAGVDLRYLAKSAFKWNDGFEKQFSKAQSDFPDIKYIDKDASHYGFSSSEILLCITILLLIGLFGRFSYAVIIGLI